MVYLRSSRGLRDVIGEGGAACAGATGATWAAACFTASAASRAFCSARRVISSCGAHITHQHTVDVTRGILYALICHWMDATCMCFWRAASFHASSSTVCAYWKTPTPPRDFFLRVDSTTRRQTLTLILIHICILVQNRGYICTTPTHLAPPAVPLFVCA